jgi:hypothetical protein
MTTTNPFIIFIHGADQEGKDEYLPRLAAHYGAARTLDAWNGTEPLEPGDLVVVAELPALNTIASNVLLLPAAIEGGDPRGVLFRAIALEDALLEIES